MYQVSEGELPSALHLLLRLPVESSTILLGRAEQEVPGTMPPGQSNCPPSADRRTGGRAGLLTNDSACTTMCPPTTECRVVQAPKFQSRQSKKRESKTGKKHSCTHTYTLYYHTIIVVCCWKRHLTIDFQHPMQREKERELKCWHKRTLPLLFGKIRMEEKIQLMMVARRWCRRRWMCELLYSLPGRRELVCRTN